MVWLMKMGVLEVIRPLNTLLVQVKQQKLGYKIVRLVLKAIVFI